MGGSVVRAYLRRVAESGRDVQLFLVYALVSYLGLGVFALIFNLYLVRLGYDEGFIGAFNGVYTLSMGLMCLTMGFLINRFGNWWCTLCGTAIFVVVALVLSFVTSGALLLLLAAFHGVGSAFISTTQMPFVIEWTPRRHTPTIAALSSALNSGSVMLGSLFGGLVPGIIAASTAFDTDSIEAYRWTHVAGALVTALSVVPLLLMGQARRERHHADFHVARAQLPSHRVRRQARRDIFAVILLGLFLALGVGAIEPFYNVLLEDMGVSASAIGLIFALSGLAATVLSVGGPMLANKIGLVAAQVWLRVFHIPVHLALIIFPIPAVVSLAYASRRVSGSMSWPLESSHVGGLIPPQGRAHAFGMRLAAWNIGFAVAASISGWIIASTGSYTPAYIAVAIFSVLSVAVYVVAYGGRLPEHDDDAEPASTDAPSGSPAAATID